MLSQGALPQGYGTGAREPRPLTGSSVSAPGGAPAPGGSQPIRIESSSSHVAEGQTLDLNCVVPGQAHAQVTWHRRGGSLPARHQVQQPLGPACWRGGEGTSGPLPTLPVCTQTHGSLLRLHQVSPADSGEYVCRVVLGSGPLETSVLVDIKASGSPAGSIPGE